MNANGIDVFHAANGDAVTRAVAYYLEFNFLPAADISFNKSLGHAADLKSVAAYINKLGFVVRNAAASAAERERGTYNNGIAYLSCERHGVFDIVNHKAVGAGLVDFLHCILEFLSVLRLADCLGGCADKTDIVLGKEAFLL